MTPPLPAPIPSEPMPTGRSAMSDDELVVLARDGDAAAYGELWSRHSGIGLAIARRYFDVADPDDIVAESFARILATLKRGGGPRAGFRPYLITTIGNVARRWATRSKEGASDELDLLEDPRTVDDPVVATSEREFALEAFKSLPERWQAVLWYSAVEGMGPSEIAGYLGMTPNATAVLAHRARAGLRTAWVQAHLNDASLPADCRWTAGRLGRRATGSLNRREQDQVKAHLGTCLGCRARARELDLVSSRLAVVLVPALLGLGIRFLDDGSPAVAVATTATTPLGSAGAVAPIWITTMLGASAAATLVAALILGTPAVVTSAAAADDVPRAWDVVVDAPVAAPPADETPVDPVPSLAAGDDPEADPDPGSSQAVDPVELPRTTPITASAPSAPVLTSSIDPEAATPPTLTGSGQPGSQLLVWDERGTSLASVTVAADGTFSTGTLSTLSPAAARLDLQLVDADGRASETVSIPLAARPTATGAVTILHPDWDNPGWHTTPVEFTVVGWPGATVTVVHTNELAWHREDSRGELSLTLDANGRGLVTIVDPWAGTHAVQLVYSDGDRQSTAIAVARQYVPWPED